MRTSDADYGRFYQDRDPVHVYPVEFVVRAYLGSYPRLERWHATGPGERVLDLGCGDGRNMPLLHQLGLQVCGMEVSAEICAATERRMTALGVPVEVRVGRNGHIPYASESFQHVLACHSCYYVDPESSFVENLAEIGRVMVAGGRFVFSAPVGSSYIMRDAVDRGAGLMEVRRDPYGLRNGTLLQKFDTVGQIEDALAPWFDHVRIGQCRNDFWGLEEHVWTVVCRRRGPEGNGHAA